MDTYWHQIAQVQITVVLLTYWFTLGMSLSSVSFLMYKIEVNIVPTLQILSTFQYFTDLLGALNIKLL